MNADRNNVHRSFVHHTFGSLWLLWLVACTSLGLSLWAVRTTHRDATVVNLPPMQVTVQSATPRIDIKPSDAYINVQSAVAPVSIEPAVPKIDVHPAVPKINLWCPD